VQVNPKEQEMTELKLSTAAEVIKPVEKIVEVVTPMVEAPVNGSTAPAPAEIKKVVEQVVTTS